MRDCGRSPTTSTTGCTMALRAGTDPPAVRPSRAVPPGVAPTGGPRRSPGESMSALTLPEIAERIPTLRKSVRIGVRLALGITDGADDELREWYAHALHAANAAGVPVPVPFEPAPVKDDLDWQNQWERLLTFCLGSTESLTAGETDILEALRQASEPLRAHQIALAAGLGVETVKQYLRPKNTLRTTALVNHTRQGYVATRGKV